MSKIAVTLPRPFLAMARRAVKEGRAGERERIGNGSARGECEAGRPQGELDECSPTRVAR